jgi:predicted RecB family nuclease
MRVQGNTLVLSATDLSNFLACRHLVGLDLAAARNLIPAPAPHADAALKALRERGEAHERAYLDSLRCEGLHIVEIRRDGDADARRDETLDALKSGADVVYQGAFAQNGWMGYADILRKVPCAPGTSSAFGDWSYEPYDTKLARETRGGTVLQLALYADLLADAQGVAPERFFVVTPGNPFAVHEHRVADYRAYFRLIRARMLDVLKTDPNAMLAEHYPEPVEQCDLCRWAERCHERRRADDHLSFIAGATRGQRAELQSRGIGTLAAAASMPVPITFTPTRGSREVYDRIGEQARLQLEQRTRQAPVFEMLPVVSGDGLCRLPRPSPGDLFLDLEGARFVRSGGHEYLFGLGHVASEGAFAYRTWWAMTAPEEQQAFEQVVDVITAARAADPDMHIYHFASYEPAALKRLAGRYATRQDTLDDLLRKERFVDLYTVVRQAMRAGVESYSLKQLEQYYGYRRGVPLRTASAHLQALQLALEASDPAAVTGETRAVIERYNEDDVQSTRHLRDWLEERRSELTVTGVDVPRPVPKPTDEEEKTERNEKALALRDKLLLGVAPEASEAGHAQHARWLLAYLIDWHHREEKADWWEFFRLRDLPEEDLFDEPKAIAGLEHVEIVGPFLGKRGKPTGSLIQRYRYPLQEVELTEGDKLRGQDAQRFGEVMVLDRAARTIDVKRGKNGSESHPTAVFSFDVIGTGTLQDSVMRFAERMRTADVQEPCAGADLLLRRTPRLRTGAFAARAGESATDFAVRIVTALDRTTLAIQGPPGTGKTYVGARMIRAAVAAGRRVGVTANSHKVVQNLFDAVRDQARDLCQEIRLGRKIKDDEETPAHVAAFKKNDAALAALATGEVHVLGGTAWLWADEDAAGSVDVLFVDEAGQMSLASALAVAQAADSLVLLGDPQQLDQPQKASHPDGVGVSALAHIVGDVATIPAGLGIFMAETWRLAPRVCDFTSELFYQSKLQPRASVDGQRLVHTDGFDGAGLWWVPVIHEGNRSASDEEVDAVLQLVDRLLRPGASWVDQHGALQPLTAAALRVVAPYNAQVNRLAARLAARGIDAGTVDKFQGQTCAVVIYSMATSRAEDAPRGMEFLYSLNRLNVATSRARCAAFIVASPGLLQPECRTPRQMQLANGLCRFVELGNSPPAVECSDDPVPRVASSIK